MVCTILKFIVEWDIWVRFLVVGHRLTKLMKFNLQFNTP